MNTNKKEDYIRWLSELSKEDIPIAGGKGANLAEMFNLKLPVPPAFIITTSAFADFISDIEQKINEIIKNADLEDTKHLQETSRKIRDLVEEQEFSKEMKDEILEAYETLGTEKQDLKVGRDVMNILKTAKESIFVAVRSSATTEDLSSSSFAGQQESFLSIKGKEKLLLTIKKCFSSLYTARAIYYRNRRGFEHSNAKVAAVVQKMIDSEKSGVMFTKDPIIKNNNIVIEAVFGLGEGIVSGKIKPDHYVVNRDIEITDIRLADKKIALVKNSAGEINEVKLTEEKSQQRVLSDSEIQRIADYGLKLEKHYKKPQDIEFAIENREIYIVQTRPVTTQAKDSKEIEGKAILQGQGASPGLVSGKVKIIHTMNDLDKIQKGDILVTEMTNPDMVVTMQKSAGIITDEGGLTSHAAIVSREMGIPAIVGTKTATSFLKENQIITLDGSSGKIYGGDLTKGKEQKKEILPVVDTKTKIKVIVDLPNFAERASKSGCKEVGLMRLEGVIAESGKHPLLFLAENRLDAYTEILEKGISKIAKYFQGIWIRTSDIRSDEYRNLQGSPKEPELNPMLGFHGVRFSLKNPRILEAELLAVKKVAEKYPDKEFGLMFPQIISVKEVKQTQKIFEKFKKPNIKFGIMLETPAAAEIISDLCNAGISFISFGTNDLTQYTLAVDRGNEAIQDLYNELHPAVISQIKRVIKTCKQKGVETSICGQAGSRKDMVKFLVLQGIDSISTNADAAYEISVLVQHLEGLQNSKETEKVIEDKPSEEPEEPERQEQQIEREQEEEEPEESEPEKKIEEKTEEFPDISIGFDVFSPVDNLDSVKEKIDEKVKEIEEEKQENKEEQEANQPQSEVLYDKDKGGEPPEENKEETEDIDKEVEEQTEDSSEEDKEEIIDEEEEIAEAEEEKAREGIIEDENENQEDDDNTLDIF